jgi:hypothetical protein
LSWLGSGRWRRPWCFAPHSHWGRAGASLELSHPPNVGMTRTGALTATGRELPGDMDELHSARRLVTNLTWGGTGSHWETRLRGALGPSLGEALEKHLGRHSVHTEVLGPSTPGQSTGHLAATWGQAFHPLISGAEQTGRCLDRSWQILSPALQLVHLSQLHLKAKNVTSSIALLTAGASQVKQHPRHRQKNQ